MLLYKLFVDFYVIELFIDFILKYVLFFSSMSIPLRNITEVLGIVLTESLKYHPNHIILLKLKGDLQYGNFNDIFYILV